MNMRSWLSKRRVRSFRACLLTLRLSSNPLVPHDVERYPPCEGNVQVFEFSSLSQSAQSLRENVLWIGERPIQSKAFAPIFHLKKSGQASEALGFSLCELCGLERSP